MSFKDFQQRPMFIELPQYDDLFPKGSVQRVIDNFVNKLDLKDVEATYLDGGTPPYHPSVLLKVVLYAYSRNIYGCRPIADLCRQDMVCLWFTNFTSPSFSTINRFRTEHMGPERTVWVFRELIGILVSDGLVSFEECTYVDGTTVESRASRTKLVWVQGVRRNAESNSRKIEELVAQARHRQDSDMEQEDSDMEQQDSDFGTAEGERTESELPASPTGKKKRSRDVHMSKEKVAEIRRDLAMGRLELTDSKKRELADRLERADRYRIQDDMCGEKSGTATTDPDSAGMHPKDDVRHTGPCLPMYNLQLMTQDQFILWAGLYGHPSDITACAPFLRSLPPTMIPLKIAADAGYGSTENYLLAMSLGIKPFFKYSMYDKECAARFSPSPYKAEYMEDQPDGTLRCPGGVMKEVRHQTDEVNGVEVTTVHYRTDQCAQCPLRPECHGRYPKDFREVKRKKEWAQLKPQVKAALDSPQGQQLLRNRTMDVEPSFAHTKWAGSYRRFRHFGIDKCTMDFFIRAIAHNLKKYARRVTLRGERGPRSGASGMLLRLRRHLRKLFLRLLWPKTPSGIENFRTAS